MKTFLFIIITFILLGCSKPTPTQVVIINTNNLMSQTNDVVMFPDRHAYVAMKEILRRSLKVPSSAVFWAPYKPLKDVEVAQDIPDTKEVAIRYKEDYWIAKGLVDCQATIGNVTRNEWAMIAYEGIDKWIPVYTKLGNNIDGEIPSKSLREVKEENERMKKQQEENEIFLRKQTEDQIKLEQEKRRQDNDESIRLFQQAEKLKIEIQFEKDKKIFDYRFKRATDGFSSSQYDLGLMYLNGEGTITNKEEGLRWIKLSASNDYSIAIKWLEKNAK